MKKIIAFSAFFITAAMCTAQVTSEKKQSQKTAVDVTKDTLRVDLLNDTLTIKSNLIAFDSVSYLKVGNKIYSVSQVMPGVYNFSFNETVLNELIKTIEQSTNGHLQVEQLKAILREQLTPQVKRRK